MATYKLTGENWVLRLNDNARIPMDENCGAYIQYLDEVARLISTVEPADPPTQEQYTVAVQDWLDNTARTRNYDGILSACSYATSTNVKFAAEGQACVQWRDNVWANCYTIMGEVLLGNRPYPPTTQDLINELPVLVWPEA